MYVDCDRTSQLDCHECLVLQSIQDTATCALLFRLAKLWMYEAPTMFWGLWQLVSPFIDPETKSKVVFVSSKSAIKEFQEAIDLSVSIVCSSLDL